MAGSSPIHSHSGVAPASRALATNSVPSSPRELTQIGQTSSSPPPSAYCSKSALERRAAVARHAVRVPGQADVHGVLGEEHRDLLALARWRPADEERDEHALGVLHAGGEVDDDLVAHDLHRLQRDARDAVLLGRVVGALGDEAVGGVLAPL